MPRCYGRSIQNRIKKRCAAGTGLQAQKIGEKMASGARTLPGKLINIRTEKKKENAVRLRGPWRVAFGRIDQSFCKPVGRSVEKKKKKSL